MTNEMLEKARAQFEKWRLANFPGSSAANDAALWMCWQAAVREAVRECADFIEGQKSAYPNTVFKHLDNFSNEQCFDCCAAAMALHTFDWLASAIRQKYGVGE